MVSHLPCLAHRFLELDEDQLVPVGGPCPGCDRTLLWGDLIRWYWGFHWTNTQRLMGVSPVMRMKSAVPVFSVDEQSVCFPLMSLVL